MSKLVSSKLIISILLVSTVFLGSVSSASAFELPNWLRQTAIWWGQEQISDDEFINAIQWLIDEKILIVSQTHKEKLVDNDGDGYLSNMDCDDNDPRIHPGADEITNNDQDEDCDGKDDHNAADNDGDGYSTDTDCNDSDRRIYPYAFDVPDDGIDQNCDGKDAQTPIDEADKSPEDNDADGFSVDDDCNDNDATVYPGADDIADDGIDQDCDGSDNTS